MKHDDKREWSRYYRLAQPNSVEALHARFVAHRYPRHVHDYFVIGLVESGAQSYRYRGARHVTPAGQIFLVNPDEPHTGEAATPEGYVYRTLYLRTDMLATVAGNIGGRAQIPFFSEAVLCDPLLAELLGRFHDSLTEPGPSAEREWLLLETITRLITSHADTRVAPRRMGKERPAVSRAREFMEARFANDLSLAAIARVAALSPFHFARAFESEVGIPPHAYLEGVRIRKAREFLDRGDTIVSAALSAGYSDQSHLTRRFKRFLGITPGQYARESKFRQDGRRIAPLS